jgi:hypothetical protein
VLIVVTLGALLAAGRQLRGQAPPPPPPYSSEQEWIVHEVVRGIVDVSHIASRKRLTTPEDLRIQSADPPADVLQMTARYYIASSVSGIPSEIRIADHVWSAKTYAPVARAVLGSAHDDRQAGDDALVAALTDPSLAVLLDASDRVSARLAAHPLASTAHDDAALVIGALALREVGRDFADVRPALNRMAVHLAVAEALHPTTPRSSRALAEAIVFALVGREVDALLAADRFAQSSSAAERAWGRTLRMRVTGDWRTVNDPTTLTPLEQTEYLRATITRRGGGRFMEAFDALAKPADWEIERIGLLENGDLEIGSRFAESTVKRSLAEAGQVWARFHTNGTNDERILSDLNVAMTPVGESRDGLALQAIDWTLWAGFEQRQLCAAAARWVRHYSFTLAMPDRAQEVAHAVAAHIGGLTLYPVVAVAAAHDAAEYSTAIASARELVKHRPELITAQAWYHLRKRKPDFAAKADFFPRDDLFLRPHVPTGTAFDLRWRALQTPRERLVTAAVSNHWSRMNPSDTWATWDTLWYIDGRKPTMEEARAAFGGMLDYDISAAWMTYDTGVPVSPLEAIALARIMCGNDENYCSFVGDELLRDGQEREAVAAYESFIAKARNRAGISHKIGWLVSYYDTHGEPQRAETLAREAADVYSAGGLETYGRLLDRRGDAAHAEQLFLAIKKRYDDPTALAGHYLLSARHEHDADLEARVVAAAPRIFSHGIERVDLPALTTPPSDGIVFHTFGRRAERVGFRRDDVIVGIDGFRVRSTQQYRIAMQSSFDTRVTFVVWRDGRYQQFAAPVPERWLGVTFDPYRRPATGD